MLREDRLIPVAVSHQNLRHLRNIQASHDVDRSLSGHVLVDPEVRLQPIQTRLQGLSVIGLTMQSRVVPSDPSVPVYRFTTYGIL